MAGYNETLNQYLRVMSGSYTMSGVNPSNMGQVGDNSISVADQIKNSGTQVTQATEGESHQSDESWWSRFVNGLSNFYNKFNEGMLNFVDSIGDLGMGIVGAIGGAAGNKELEQQMASAINYDWQAPTMKVINYAAPQVLGNNMLKLVGGDTSGFKETYGGGVSSQEARASLNRVENGTLIKNEKARNVVSGIETGLGQALPSLALAFAAPEIGAGKVAAQGLQGAEAASKAANISRGIVAANTFVQSAGQSYGKIAKEGTELSKGSGYVALSATVNTGLALVNQWLGGKLSAGEGLAAKGISKLGSKIADNGMRAVVTTGLNLAANIGIDVTTDTIGNALDPILRQTYDTMAIYNAYGTKENRDAFFKELGKSAIYSAITSVIQNAPGNIVYGIRQYRSDTRTPEATKSISDMAEENRELRKQDIEKAVYDTKDNEDLQQAIEDEVQRQRDAQQVLLSIGSASTDTKDFKAFADSYRKLVEDSNKNIESYASQMSKNTARASAPISEGNSFSAPELGDYNGQEAVLDSAQTFDVSSLVNIISTDSANASVAKSVPVIEGEVSASVSYSSENPTVVIKSNGVTGESTQWAFSALSDNFKGSEGYSSVPNIDTKVSLDSKDVRASDRNSRVIFDSKQNSPERFLDLRDTIANQDNVSTAYLDPKTGDEYYHFENGVAYKVDRNGAAMILPNGQSTDFSGMKRVTFGERAYESNAKVIKDAAPVSYVYKNVFSDIGDMIAFDLAKSRGKNFYWKNGDDAAKKLFASFALDGGGTQDFKQAARNFLDSMLDEGRLIEPGGKIADSVSLKEGAFATEQDYEDFIDKTVPIIEELAHDSAHPSKLARAEEAKTHSDYLRSKLSNQLKDLVKRNNVNVSMLDTINSMKKKAQKAVTKPTAAAPDINEQYSASYIDLAKHLNMTKGAKGLTVESLEYLVDCTLPEDLKNDEYVQSCIKELQKHMNTETINDPESGIEATQSTYFRVNKDGKQVSTGMVSTEDSQTALNLIRYIDKQNTAAVRKQRIADKRAMQTAKAEIKALSVARAGQRANMGKAMGRFMQYMDSMRGPESFFNEFFGRGTTAYNTLYRDPVLAHRDLSMFLSESDQIRNQGLHDFGLNEKALGKKITIHDDKLGDIDIDRNTAIEIYTASRSDNLADLMDNGFQVENEGAARKTETIMPTDSMIADIDAELTIDEKNFGEYLLVKGYNGKARQALGEYATKHGINILEDTGSRYMHINRGNLRMDPEGGFAGFSSLGANSVVTRRVKNNQPMVFRGMTVDYDSYMKTVGEYTQLDAVRKMNRLLNHKNINVNDSENRGSNMKNNLPNGEAFVNDWISRVNLTGSNKAGGITHSRFVANAMSVPIVANVGTWLKMPLDVLRMIPDVGLQNFGKGIIKGFGAMFTSQGRAYYTDLVSSTGFWAANNREHFAIASNTISADFSRLTNVLGKPLEVINNNTIKYIVTPVLERYVQSQYTVNGKIMDGYRMGGAENIKATQNMLNTLGASFLSNSDPLDVSTLRNGKGPGGAIAQLVFAPYGGDSQKWAEKVYEAIWGGKNAKIRANALAEGQNDLDRDIATFNRNITSYESRIHEYRKTLENMGNGEEDQSARIKLQSKIKSLESKLYEQQEYRYGLIDTKEEFYKDEDTARQVLKDAPKRAAYVFGSLVATAAAETMIGFLNDFLKGKKDTKKDLATDAVFNTTVGWIPYIGSFASALRYNSDISPNQLSWLNGIRETLSEIGTVLGNSEGGDKSVAARRLLWTALRNSQYLTGIPVKSIDDYLKGAIKNFKWDDAYSYYAIVHGYSGDYLSANMRNNKDNQSIVRQELSAKMNIFGAGNPTKAVQNELARLYTTGNSVVPSDFPNTYNKGQQKLFRDLYTNANDIASRFIGSDRYKDEDDAAKAKDLNRIYDSYYSASKALVEGTDNVSLSRLSKAILYTNGNLDLDGIIEQAFSATGETDIDGRRSLSSYEKLLAKYIAGFTLTDSEKKTLQRFLSYYLGNNSVKITI